ncbi:morphogenesis protein [Bacillus phage Juan]|uniref:Pre-neck appendage protein n=2 Tax=Claudivirus TaxID=2842609 RepID=A0A7T7GT81_9CAUD|nr:endolysin [Bacillus phage Juan]YP_010114402.1 endolysin [Bacillus phage Thornton]ASU04115.1 morphogenesis protein [Bacillus phage Juan]QQM15024.1 pre-neck appendage protein [Bacillus phage Thornton]
MKEGQKSVGANGKQNSMFPMDVMYITQGESGDFSHSKAKAIDYIHLTKSGVRTRRAWYYAPADMTVVNAGSAGTMWATDDEVNTPTGTKRMCYMFWHDNNHSAYPVGTKRKQGEKCGQTGTAGFATGDHLHIEVMNGAVFDKSNAVHNWDAFFINDTEIVVDFGYAWKTTDDQTGIDNGTCTPSVPVGNGTLQLNEKVNDKVRSYENQMRAECTAQGIPDATIPLLALMMVESGGAGGDPMQSSESAGLPMNTIKDPAASIRQGVKHFKESMETSKQYDCDIWTIFQQYNYGIGYARFIGSRGKKHTLELSMEYSRTVVAPSLGNTTGRTTPYVNEVSVALGVPWRYVNGGNFHYASMIQYYTTGDGAINSCGGDNTGETDKENKKLNDYIAQLLSNQVSGWNFKRNRYIEG